jgi:hypothetical protein
MHSESCGVKLCSMKMPGISMPLLVLGMLPAPPLLAWIATMARLERAYISSPAWMAAAEVATIVYKFAMIAWLFTFRNNNQSKLWQRLREQGNDPSVVRPAIGMAIFFFPTCVAALLSFFGLPLAHLYVIAGFSVVTMAAWAVWCRLGALRQNL